MAVLGLYVLSSSSWVSFGVVAILFYILLRLTLAYMNYLTWAHYYKDLPGDPCPSKLLGHLLMVRIVTSLNGKHLQIKQRHGFTDLIIQNTSDLHSPTTTVLSSVPLQKFILLFPVIQPLYFFLKI